MRNYIFLSVLTAFVWICVPACLHAAPVDGSTLVFVADTRRIEWALLRYLAHLYNTNIHLFGLWVIVLASVWGSVLGCLSDRLLQWMGLDLQNSVTVE